MTDIFGKSNKRSTKTRLFQVALDALEDAGWTVERVAGSGKSSVRRITKGDESKVVSIRTTQDTCIAFPRTEGDKSWRTLDEVDAVVPVSVDDKENPKFAKVHIIDGDEIRARFNRAYKARRSAGHKIPIGRGVWVSLYLPEADNPVSHVGAGAGLEFPPIAIVPLVLEEEAEDATSDDGLEVDSISPPSGEAPLSIAEAKRRLAETFRVDPSSIKIIVEA